MNNILCIIPVDPNDRPLKSRHLPYEPSPGMVHCPCESCGKIGWLGPKQAAAKISFPTLNIVCVTCVFKEAKQAQDVSLFNLKD